MGLEGDADVLKRICLCALTHHVKRLDRLPSEVEESFDALPLTSFGIRPVELAPLTRTIRGMIGTKLRAACWRSSDWSTKFGALVRVVESIIIEAASEREFGTAWDAIVSIPLPYIFRACVGSRPEFVEVDAIVWSIDQRSQPTSAEEWKKEVSILLLSSRAAY